MTIEDLPTELIRLILFAVPDTESLLSAASASRTIYSVYFMARRELHVSLLEEKYEEISLDLNEAIAAVRSKGLGMRRHQEEAVAVLDDWRRRQETSVRVKRSLSIEEIKELYKLQMEILFFLQDYDFWVLRFGIFAEHGPWRFSRSYVCAHLNEREKHRFTTALCRLATHANIFGRNQEAVKFAPTHKDHNDWGEVISQEDAWGLFFGTIPPWEYEAMASVWLYLVFGWDSVHIIVRRQLEKIKNSDPKDFPVTFADFDASRNIGRELQSFPYDLEQLDMSAEDFACQSHLIRDQIRQTL